jgi:hypothetical protein
MERFSMVKKLSPEKYVWDKTFGWKGGVAGVLRDNGA